MIEFDLQTLRTSNRVVLGICLRCALSGPGSRWGIFLTAQGRITSQGKSR